MESTTSKRIVSREEYFRVQEQRVIANMTGLVVLIAGLMMLYYSFFFLMQQVRFFYGLGGVFVFLLFGLFATRLLNESRTLIKKAVQLNPGIPLTRANIADLPVTDSLVRASSEPLQAQQAVLLRAAAEEQGTPAEDLVRAVEGSIPIKVRFPLAAENGGLYSSPTLDVQERNHVP